MAHNITNLKVFVACPSDVTDEVTIVEEEIKDLNLTLSPKIGIRMELLHWSTNTYPSLGNDAQSIVNSQIGNDYDIFVGILKTKFGSPTGRADSGTVEEFNLAYDKFVKNKNSLKIMIYFNDSPINPSKVDLKQYAKVMSFKKKIQKLGLYQTYINTDDFKRLIRMNLSSAVLDFGKNWGENLDQKLDEIIPQIQAEKSTDLQINEEDESGFFEEIIASADEMESATLAVKRISELGIELNEKIESNLIEINNLTHPINPHLAKSLIDKTAGIWDDYSNRVEVEIPILSMHFRTGIDSYAKAAEVYTDFQTDDTKQLEDAFQVIKSLEENISGAREKTIALRDSILSIPRMTVQLNHAKKHIIATLNSLIEEYSIELSIVNESKKVFMLAINAGK